MRTPGSVGALGNAYRIEGLIERLAACHRIAIHPLQFEAKDNDGSFAAGTAVNEIAIIRRSFQATKVRVHVGPDVTDIFGDGLVVASPIGSTGYCRSLGGPRLPLHAAMVALAGIAVRNPREGFRMAVSDRTVIRMEIADPTFRPVRIETHSAILADVCEVVVRSCRERSVTLLRDPDEFVWTGRARTKAIAAEAVRDAERD